MRDDHWWLWACVTQREAIRLLVALAPGLDTDQAAELEHAVLAGPPRSMYEAGIEPERWKRIVERGVWLRLAKMDAAGATLSSDAKAKLNELARRIPTGSSERKTKKSSLFGQVAVANIGVS